MSKKRALEYGSLHRSAVQKSADTEASRTDRDRSDGQPAERGNELLGIVVAHGSIAARAPMQPKQRNANTVIKALERKTGAARPAAPAHVQQFARFGRLT